MIWAIDLLDKMPIGSTGQQIGAVAVDSFSKFVEFDALHDRSSATIARWFMD